MRATSTFSRCALGTAVGVLFASTLGAQAITSSNQDARATGDPVSGRALVQSSKCLDCHRIGDEGSRLGPTSPTSAAGDRLSCFSARCLRQTMRCCRSIDSSASSPVTERAFKESS